MISFLNLGNMGRLGNQMFQFSTGYSLSKKLNTEFKIPLNNFIRSGYSGIVLYDIFKLSNQFLSDINDIQVEYSYDEPSNDFRFPENFFDLPDSTNLNGYFQSSKYFKWCKDDILELFQFKKIYDLMSDEKLKELGFNEEKCVSLHIRRGDYVDCGEVLDIDYYIKSIELIKKEVSDVVFFIFSDDTKWCCENFDDKNIKIVKNIDNYTTMCMMTKFKYHILANSSFSWWGSYLSKNKKITVAPKTWLKNNNYDDVYEDGWIKI